MRLMDQRPGTMEGIVGCLAAFCRQHGGDKCRFATWLPEVLEDYVVWHLVRGTVAYCADWRGSGIVGIAFGWQSQESDLRRPGFADHPFIWQESDPKGDSFYFAETICTKPCFNQLIEVFIVKFPNWRTLKFFALRGGKLRSYDPKRLINHLVVKTKGKE